FPCFRTICARYAVEPTFRLRGTIVPIARTPLMGDACPSKSSRQVRLPKYAFGVLILGKWREKREKGRERDNEKSRWNLGESRTTAQNEPLAILRRTHDGLDGPALPVLPSAADAPRAAL